ncbi:fibronectin type III domain-containing protein [Gordonia sp. GONU]|uniref:fibronectin type III domain-containing protein n=1 Tax=Gordonia sp. GONU TaxID=2972949 RepID=UPI0021AD4BAA|nr:fibronectin type III domain-containing protein [Gordonia sp. GONU]MCR8897319.1 fibronectin type III domain-containing protein [Gordonia sp. GONU]
MAKKLISIDDTASAGQRLPSAVRTEIAALPAVSNAASTASAAQTAASTAQTTAATAQSTAATALSTAEKAQPAPGPSVIGADGTPLRWDGTRPVVPSATITCKGHSWIYSDNGLLEAALASALGVTVRNLGIGGQTSTEVAIRTGGIVPLLTLAGNQIPADTTAVSVTAIQPTGDYRTNGSSAYTYAGTLAGVAGTLTETLQSSGDPVWTFARSSSGTATPVAPGTPFLVSATTYVDETTVIMCAQNNLYSVDATMRNVIRDIDAILGSLTPVVKRALIVGEFTYPEDRDDTTGNQLIRRNKMIGINTDRAARWPNNFYDLRRDFIDIGMQVGGLVPNADDQARINHDTTPYGILKSTSDTHPNETGYAVVGKLIAKQLVKKGWATYASNTPPAAPTISATGGAGQSTLTVTPGSNGGSAITDYVVQFRQQGTTRWFTYFDGISTATSIPVTGFAAGIWEYRVTAINTVGPSDPSNVVSATVTTPTDVTAPTAPTSVSATAGDGQATVTFSGATDNVGVVSYRVYSSADSYATPVATGSGSPINAPSANGAAVTFKVSAGDAAGNWSPQSEASNSVTPIAITTVASDSFNRADGAVGSTDAANGGAVLPWTAESGMAIIGNQLGKTTTGTAYCYLDHTAADQAIEVTLSVLGTSNEQIMLRRADGNNYYRLIITPSTGGGTINKSVGGTNSQIGAISAGTFTVGAVVKFRAVGSTLTVLVNGVQVASVTDTSITTSGKVAVGLADTTARLDNFKLTNA